MNDSEEFTEGGVSVRVMDIIVALILIALGLLVMWDSHRIGSGWGPTGPESGYFPFYVGLLIVGSSIATLFIAIFKKSAKRQVFVEASKFKLVLRVLVPSAVFVLLIEFLGIYVSSALFIGFFMWWIGGYTLNKIIPVSIAVPLALFILFEIWFLVPLPKGPLEAFLGY